MFDSIRNWLSRTDRHQADRQKLEAEAKDFRLPSETLPQIFKYLFFVGLGFLNYRLFSHIAASSRWQREHQIIRPERAGFWRFWRRDEQAPTVAAECLQV